MNDIASQVAGEVNKLEPSTSTSLEIGQMSILMPSRAC